MDSLIKVRESLKFAGKAFGIRISFMPFFIKVSPHSLWYGVSALFRIVISVEGARQQFLDTRFAVAVFLLFFFRVCRPRHLRLRSTQFSIAA